MVHDAITISWTCEDCGKAYADRSEIVELPTGRGVALVCPRCRRALREQRARVARPFAAELAAALGYPFAAGGRVTFVALAIFTWFFLQMAIYNVFPAMNVVAAAIALGLPVGYFARVVTTSARGESAPPSPADVLGLGDFFGPLARFVFALASCLLPPLLLAWKGPGWTTITLLVWVVGLLLLPGQLIVAAYGWPLNPLTPLRLILRAPAAYALLLLSLLLFMGFFWGVAFVLALLLRSLSGVPILPSLLVTAHFVYGLLALGRMLGLLLYTHQEELAIAD